jgi:phage shock protein PspC (stress-responsive transcriptional regulator)
MYAAYRPRHAGAMSEHITHNAGTNNAGTKRLERSTSSRVIAGVAGGLGRYFDLNPNFFRVGFVVLTLLGGAGILIYLAAILVMPEEGKEQSIAEETLARRRERPWPVVGLGLAGIALAVLLARSSFWPAAGAGWVLVLIAGLAILWLYDARRGDRRSRLLVRTLVGLVAAIVAVAIAAVVVAFAWFNVSLGDGVGDRVYTPARTADVRPYELGVGQLRVNLSRLGPLAHETRVRAKVGVGELRITVPRDVAVTVNARAKLGDVNVLRRHDDGHNAAVTTAPGRRLVIDAQVGAGQIDVVRAGA